MSFGIHSCTSCGVIEGGGPNPSNAVIKINTNPSCGHYFCAKCVKKEFENKRHFSCPRCKSSVTADKLVDHDLVEVDKDVAVRKTIKSVFNKTEEDFAGDLERLRDYEEKVEDLIHNLINEIDVDETKLYIEKYKSENAKLISKNQHKISVSQQAESRDIQKQQDLKITQDEEFMVSIKSEKRLKLDRKRNLNETMLGENDISIDTFKTLGPVAGEQQKANLNRAVTYLSQRPEPKPISNEKSGMMKLKPQSGGEVRKMHRAGGYDYLLFNEKNWNEIHVMRSSKAL